MFPTGNVRIGGTENVSPEDKAHNSGHGLRGSCLVSHGLIEKAPQISIPEVKYYGFPLVWRITLLSQPTEYKFTELASDTLFWIAISFAVLVTFEFFKPKIGMKYETMRLPLTLLLPFGLTMDFVHEFGHALWGTAVGGRLVSMQVAFFQIYPQFAVTSQFVLGYVTVDGLTTAFDRGLFLLGGSLSTTIIAWLLGIIALRVRFGQKTQVALKFLILCGLIDLPAYVVLPQIGVSSTGYFWVEVALSLSWAPDLWECQIPRFMSWSSSQRLGSSSSVQGLFARRLWGRLKSCW
jgi:hypothetical protein